MFSFSFLLISSFLLFLFVLFIFYVREFTLFILKNPERQMFLLFTHKRVLYVACYGQTVANIVAKCLTQSIYPDFIIVSLVVLDLT